ncbi:glycosyl transferase family 2 [Thermodesulfobium narugense DSM 14796]|uniref:Glycosyl transferase family 2 n=1 Tax=Thermodesulfobium narugense DSM 14796 TaxID=747365 RepID=M1E652_9BACT|nr:glycosyltransferase [Thermodesulfobium narugense]AEE13815.1 glycosyl transferase family 2 [Thermodesulfobium narugense DSM 14796]
MKESLVTVAMPAYNHEKYVQDAIKSVVDQTYENIEFIVINDCSQDSTHSKISEMIKLCKDRFVRFEYINSDKNNGITKTLNKCLKWAKGKYFSLLASDDIFFPDKIELLVHELERLPENYAIVFGDATYINKQGEVMKVRKGSIETENVIVALASTRKDFNYLNEDEFGTYKTLFSGYLPTASWLARTECIREVGGFNEECFVEDMPLWIALSKKYRFKFFNKSVAGYRLHFQNTSSSFHNKMLVNLFRFLEGEREYCIQNNLYDFWKRMMIFWSKDILKKENMPFEQKKYVIDILRNLKLERKI